MENINVQINLQNVRERVSCAFSNSLYCDIEFLVFDSSGNEVSLPASKYMLAVTSPVFATMFYGKLAEAKPAIELPDCNKEAFQEFLRYVHCDEIVLTAANVVDVWYIADKYIIPHLVDRCKEYIQNKLTPEEVFLVLPRLSVVCIDKALEQRCWEIIEEETQQAIHSSYFLTIPHELLCKVLLRNKLVIDELSLFKAVDTWALKRILEKGLEITGQVKREVLGVNVIRLIRFPLMKEKEFAKFVVTSEVLTMQEMTELILFFNSLPSLTNFFSRKKRDGKSHCIHNYNQLCSTSLILMPNRFESVKPVHSNGIYTTGIDFQVNRAVDLLGVRLFGSQSTSYEVDISIHEIESVSGKCKQLCHFISTFESQEDKIDGLYYGVDVFLKGAIKLSPVNQYRARIKVKGLHEVYGVSGKSEVECQDITVTYSNPSITYNPHFFLSKENSISEGGQIQTLMFKGL